ncbi:PGF-pre-PGF domain-containing protein [Candidatus Woesearchaeota archaeon]|nr:PGF-pre-PGF domain-containing protein [Candidatus Woesearchaeota archaeon]
MRKLILILTVILTLLFSTSVVNAEAGLCTEGHSGALTCTNITGSGTCTNQVGGCAWNGSICSDSPGIVGGCDNLASSFDCNFNTSLVCEWDIPPSVNLMAPSDDSTSSTGNITVYCNVTDDYDLVNLTLFVWNSTGDVDSSNPTNFSGDNDTAETHNWAITVLSSGIYYWNCLAYDDYDQSSWAADNWTITVDTSPENLSLNSSIVVTLLKPVNGSTVGGTFDMNFSVNVDSTCMGYWDYNPEGITDIPVDVPFIPGSDTYRWDHVDPGEDWSATAGANSYGVSPENYSRNYTWNVRCVSAGYSWASANWTFVSSVTCDGILSDDPSVCSGRGLCSALGNCVCNAGWSGVNCSTSTSSMTVTKTLLSSSTPAIGDTVEFQITIANTGASTISEVWIHDDYENSYLSFDNESSSCAIKSNLNDGPDINSIVINVTPCITGSFNSSDTVDVFLNFTALSTGATTNEVELSFTEEGANQDEDNASVTIQSGGGGGGSSDFNVTLLSPANGLTINDNHLNLTFTVNETSTCMAYWDFNPENIPADYADVPTTPNNWDHVVMDSEYSVTGMNNQSIPAMVPNGNYTWNVRCYTSTTYSWATANWTFTLNGSMIDCLAYTTPEDCDSASNCNWESFGGKCLLDCAQYDGTDVDTCENAFGAGACAWNGWLCDPAGEFFDPGYEGFSPCFDYDGNQTACDNNSESCVWFSEPNCPTWDDCQDVTGGSDHGWCDPNNFDWATDYDCWNYDGNQTGCDNAEQTLGWACQWSDDPWYMGPFGAGDLGWCNPASFGGGGGSSGGGGFGGGTSGCWDYWDETGCDDAASGGLLCTWNMPSVTEWCEERGCWNYWDSGSCDAANTSEGCQWNSDYNYCYREECWDLTNITGCDFSALDCIWYNNTWDSGGWCEENACWNNDWTNVSVCEAQPGCQWNDPWCEHDGCWNYELNQTNCETESGLNCQWMNSSNGWCEETRCWSYDGNQTGCLNANENTSLSCTWDSNFCYEDYQECNEYDNMFECFGTGWCFWDESGNGTCSEPNFGPIEFFNPGCWAFDQAGASKCNNITTCTWDAGGFCADAGADANNGVQCEDINNSAFCNGIPMLSTCCSWNGTGCEAAPQTTACWDSMQEPPIGGAFCEDYAATSSETICNQIAGDPWYMPCVWDNASQKCGFAFDDFFGGAVSGGGGGFGFIDLNEGTCANTGGVWKSEQWTDSSGNLQWDEWCEMGFGFGTEICANSCWACEQQDNGSVWANAADAQGACEESTAGCNFFADSYAYNTFGWCDMNWAHQGNCDQNCWDCWDSNQCSGNADCKWFTDPWNNNMGWCDSKNVMSCDDDCFMCWDQNNCGDSDADCTWNTNYWFCEPTGTGTSGESYEVCFDGMDNDADTFIDCEDPECMFDNFCGGSAVFDSNCLSIPTETACGDGGCVWITDNWNNSWCDMNGSQCWLYDDNETACNNETLGAGCSYQTMQGFGNSDDFCEINWSYMDSSQCWNYGENESTCIGQSGCVWIEDPWCNSPEGQSDPWCLDNPDMGWCDNELWSCIEHDNDQTACGLDPACGWITDWFNSDWGWCDPICFSRDNSTCSNPVPINGTNVTGVCELLTASQMGWCEPENMFKGCWGYDDDSTACGLDDACSWMEDPYSPLGGFCGDKFFNDMVGGMDKSPPLILEGEDCAATNAASDICGLGVKDNPENFGFGTEVFSMDSTKLCADKFDFDPVFSGGTNSSAKFYWYLDTDGVATGGCNATDDNTLVGYDLKFKYETTEVDGALVETKVTYKCLSGQWSPSQIKITPWFDKSCYMVRGGVISVSKDDLSKLSVLGLYNESADMRIYATTALSNGSDSSVYDSIGPTYYSHGAADFKFEDCMGFVDSDGDGLTPSEDPDCVDFLKYGYIDLEQGSKCNDDIDNDGNGLTDCSDPGCMYDLAYCVAADYADDNSAPTITWMDAEAFMDGVFIGVDTDEPTNGTLLFFKNDSYCRNISNGETLLDWKLTNEFTGDDYDFWHDFYVDQVYFDENSLSYTFSTNTTYYYKTEVCDKNGNCALSACLNFTTATEMEEYFVGFDLPPPQTGAALLEPLGKVSVNFDFGESNETIDGNTGLKINETTGRDVDLSFSNPNASTANDWGIDFIGSDFVNAQSINVTDAFIVNETSTGETMVGMDSDKWNEMAQKLGVDQIKIEIPDGVASDATATLMQCPDNATSLSDPRCIERSLDDVNCTFTTSTTVCWIPTSIGFSVFGITTTTADDDDDDDGNGGGGGGGGGGAPGATVVSYTKVMTAITSGEVKVLSINEATYTGVPFTSVEFTALNDLSSVTVRVNALSNAPSSTGSITHKAYKYLQIVETNIGSDDVSGTKIDFRVPKEWLTNNSVSKNNIALFRYTNDAWEEQETVLTSENDTTVYYEATTTGLSYFSIGQKSEEVVASAEAVVEEEEEVVAPTGEVVAEPEEPESTVEPTGDGISKASIIWSIVVIIVVVILMFVFWKEGMLQKVLPHDKLKEHGVEEPSKDYGKLEEFIKKQLDSGLSQSEVRGSLLKAGWDEDRVDTVLDNYAEAKKE